MAAGRRPVKVLAGAARCAPLGCREGMGRVIRRDAATSSCARMIATKAPSNTSGGDASWWSWRRVQSACSRRRQRPT